jgi:hypothetical protein
MFLIARRAQGLASWTVKPSKEGCMCPVCIASTAAMVAGAGSMGGILAVCFGKLRKLFRFQQTKEN